MHTTDDHDNNVLVQFYLTICCHLQSTLVYSLARNVCKAAITYFTKIQVKKEIKYIYFVLVEIIILG